MVFCGDLPKNVAPRFSPWVSGLGLGFNRSMQQVGYSSIQLTLFTHSLDHIEIMNLIDILTLVAAWRLVICCLAGGLFAYGLHQIVPALTFFHLIGVTTRSEEH